jgi:phosphoribosyl-AMP cyclohydrolase
VASSRFKAALFDPLAQNAQAGFLFLWRQNSREIIVAGNLKLDFEKQDGLIPAIVQDHLNGDVLMLGFMNREALAKTQETGFVTFFSRSRKKLWMKGESSGQKLLLRDLRVDCDGDALLIRAELEGGAVCHEGYRSCFFRQIARDGGVQVIAERIFSPDELYGKQNGETK